MSGTWEEWGRKPFPTHSWSWLTQSVRATSYWRQPIPQKLHALLARSRLAGQAPGTHGWSVEVEEVLRGAGWYPGRDVYPAPWRERVEAPFELDPLLALGEADRFGEWGQEINRLLYPLGDLDRGHAFLGLDDQGELRRVQLAGAIRPHARSHGEPRPRSHADPRAPPNRLLETSALIWLTPARCHYRPQSRRARWPPQA